MIDIHSHILPGLDDGPATMAESLEMAERAVAQGFDTIIATPHAFEDGNAPDHHLRDQRLEELGRKLAERQIRLRIMPGYECRIAPDLLAHVRENPALRMAGGRTFLLELPWQILPPDFPNFLFECNVHQLTPIIAHSERYYYVQEKPDMVAAWVAAGAKIQVNIGSLSGNFGRSAMSTATALLKQRLVHFLASDAHDDDTRGYSLKKAFKAAKKHAKSGLPSLMTAQGIIE